MTSIINHHGRPNHFHCRSLSIVVVATARKENQKRASVELLLLKPGNSFTKNVKVMQNLQSKILYIILLFSIPILAVTCSKNDPPQDLRQESAHFIILTNSEHSITDEIDLVNDRAEWIYQELINLLGEDRAPDGKITIRMEGSFTGQGPYFDPDGIHLFRYSAAENGYLALLTHEMVHAFRESYYIEEEPWNWPTFPYFDEGFAEFMAQIIEPDKTGFPFYGFSEHAVVGDMVLQGQALPHDSLRMHHEALNQPCHIQSYPLRASWFRHVDEVYGREAMLAIAYPTKEPTSDVIQELIGVDLPTLDQEWEVWIIDKYENTEEASQIAQEFRLHTSWYSYCE